MRAEGDLPLRGTVVWLPGEDAESGASPPSGEGDYLGVATRPLLARGHGITSLIVRADDPHAWCSSARARWGSISANAVGGPLPGEYLVLVRRRRPVGFFLVDGPADD